MTCEIVREVFSFDDPDRGWVVSVVDAVATPDEAQERCMQLNADWMARVKQARTHRGWFGMRRPKRVKDRVRYTYRCVEDV